VISTIWRRGIHYLLTVLPDGSRSLIPASWTDWKTGPVAKCRRSMPMTLSWISAGSVIFCGCASSLTLFAPDAPNRHRARRAAMQLNLGFFDQPDLPARTPAAWEQIDEAARVAAIEILARLMTRMLLGRQAGEGGK
jgi:hypothetical protein